MILSNPIFQNWYTDTVDIYRVKTESRGNLDTQSRQKVNKQPIPCRLYELSKDGPAITGNAARERSTEKLACDLGVDIQAGDELYVVRGGNLGHANQAERYLAGEPVPYYDPTGGVMTGLQHKEVGLLKDNIIGFGR